MPFSHLAPKTGHKKTREPLRGRPGFRLKLTYLAGTTTSTRGSACGDRFFGGHRESRTPAGFRVIDLNGPDTGRQLFIDHISDAVGYVSGIVFFRLVQSQCQRGPASAALGQIDPHRGFKVLFLEIGPQLFLCHWGYVNHFGSFLPAQSGAFFFSIIA